jgi:hypothetical protein
MAENETGSHGRVHDAADDPSRVHRLGVRAVAAILVLYLAAAVVATWPLAAHAGNATPSPIGDSRLTTWIFAWEAHALPRFPTRMFQAPYFALESDALAYSDHMLGLGLFAAPINWLTGNPFLAHNVVLILSIAGAAFAACLLIYELTGSRSAAIVGGMAYGFSPYWASQISHIHILASGWVPLAAYGLVRWIRTERVGFLALAGVASFLAAITSWYQAAFLAIILFTIGFVFVAARRPARPLRFGLHGLVAVAALTAALAPFAAPYRHIASREMRYVRPLADVANFSARPSWFVATPPRNVIYGRATEAWRDRTRIEEKTLFPGLGVLGLAAIGVWSRRRSKDHRAVIIAGGLLIVLGVVLAFGASTTGPRSHTPWAFLYRHFSSFRSLRAATRVHLLTILGLAVLAGLGAQVVLSRFRRRGVVTAALAGFLLLEGIAIPMPLGPAPKSPAVYAKVPNGGLVLEFPARRGGEVNYMLYQTSGWYRIVNGTSGFEPRSYASLLRVADELPAPSALAALRAWKIDTLIVHLDLIVRTKFARIEKELATRPGVSIVAKDDSVVIFRI